MRHRTVSGQFEGKVKVFSRIVGASLRAFLVLLVIAMPSILLPSAHTDTKPIVVLLAISAAIFTLIEYYSTYPSLIEFRDAPPFNRVRYAALFSTVFLLCIIFQGQMQPTTLTRFISAVGLLVSHLVDFPFSPINLANMMLPADASAQNVILVRAAVGISYLTSFLILMAFLALLRLQGWPTHDKPFNVWINLPTFDPSTGSDVVKRLKRDGRVNIAIGFALPFLSPALVSAASNVFAPIALDSPQTMVWTITLWAFLPVSLFMRGIAMGRIASMIKAKRDRAHELAESKGMAMA